MTDLIERLPCDVLVQPATLIERGCKITTLLECIEMRRERAEKGPPLPDILSRRQADELSTLRERRDTLLAAIQHGDDEHQAWLKDAIAAHFTGQAVPEPRGRGNKDALRERVEALEGKIERIKDAALVANDAPSVRRAIASILAQQGGEGG